MLGTQQAAQPANGVDQTDQIVGQSKIDGLNREITALKADVDTKTREIIQLEREIGIKRQTTFEHVAEKLEPVKTVVVGVAGKVAKKAHELSDRIQQSRPSSQETGSPAGDATASAANPSNPAAPTDTSVPTPPASTASTPVDEQSTSSTSTPAAPVTVAPANVARNKLRIATLQEEVATLNDSITSKESEVAWLYKKHGIVRPGSFAAFKSTAASRLEVAKGRTVEGASTAKDSALKLWRSASATIADKSKTVGSAASQKWAELTGKAKASSGDSSGKAANPKASADMTERYS